MVNVALKFPEASGVKGTLPLKEPLPIPLKLAVPVAVMLAPILPVAFTVRVVLTVAASAPTHIANARAYFAKFRVIFV